MISLIGYGMLLPTNGTDKSFIHLKRPFYEKDTREPVTH
jgi:hypothetical protein